MPRIPLPYELWDVFTAEPFSGNPLAVVPDASGLSDEQMQRIANEFNLSETSFVLPSGTADVRARYFTPARELPMAGHPSVGTVYALEAKGAFKGKGEVTLELAVGPVTMTLERDGESLTRVWMDQGVPQLSETYDRAAVAALRDKYPQYANQAIDARPVVRFAIDRVVAWGTLEAVGQD